MITIFIETLLYVENYLKPRQGNTRQERTRNGGTKTNGSTFMTQTVMKFGRFSNSTAGGTCTKGREDCTSRLIV